MIVTLLRAVLPFAQTVAVWDAEVISLELLSWPCAGIGGRAGV